ncbi:MAG: class I SAM-dependent methyltransferase [Patescibacteria group bacterium]
MKKMKFVNRKFCAKNGVPLNLSFKEFAAENKKYYQEVEDYDWVWVADHFQGLEAILHRARERQTLKLVKEFGKGKFLDAGCGTGLILRHLPADSVGLDINPRNLSKAKIHAPKAKLILGDIEKMPFNSRSFTTVICTDVLEHLLDPAKALSEIFRVLSPKGRLIGSVPAQNQIWRLRFLSSTHPGEPYHRLYKKPEVEALFGGQGKILELKRECLWMNFFFVVEND